MVDVVLRRDDASKVENMRATLRLIPIVNVASEVEARGLGDALMKVASLQASLLRYDAPTRLTVREEEVLDLVIHRGTSDEIAKQLFIARRTVDIHRSHIYKKFEVKNIAQLVHAAAGLKLSSNEDSGARASRSANGQRPRVHCL